MIPGRSMNVQVSIKYTRNANYMDKIIQSNLQSNTNSILWIINMYRTKCKHIYQQSWEACKLI